MPDCLFCAIAAGDIPSDRVLETDTIVAFRDVNPQAPVHVLVIPRRHVEHLQALDPREPLLADLVEAVQRVAEQEGIAATGYRTIANVGREAGMSVPHLHLHVLGGRHMGWPPG